ncbi:MAG: hypothetical protein ACI835_005517 [Planctomycetota bacterium]|jgi:hypothetical protein
MMTPGRPGGFVSRPSTTSARTQSMRLRMMRGSATASDQRRLTRRTDLINAKSEGLDERDLDGKQQKPVA